MAKEMILINKSLFNKLQQLYSEKNNNESNIENNTPTKSWNFNLDKESSDNDEIKENKIDLSTKNIALDDSNTFKFNTDDVVNAFSPKFRNNVNRILTFILKSKTLNINQSGNILVNSKIYHNSHIFDFVRDMIFPIKKTITEDYKVFYNALLHENIPKSFIINPYRQNFEGWDVTPQNNVSIKQEGGGDFKKVMPIIQKVERGFPFIKKDKKNVNKKVKKDLIKKEGKNKLKRVINKWKKY